MPFTMWTWISKLDSLLKRYTGVIPSLCFSSKGNKFCPKSVYFFSHCKYLSILCRLYTYTRFKVRTKRLLVKLHQFFPYITMLLFALNPLIFPNRKKIRLVVVFTFFLSEYLSYCLGEFLSKFRRCRRNYRDVFFSISIFFFSYFLFERCFFFLSMEII